MDDFTRHYIVAALWSSNDDEGEPLDRNYGVRDIAPNTLAVIEKDCAQFQSENAELLEQAYQFYGPNPECSAGHDFWLTRNGHGAGFWDRGMGQVGEALSEAARKYGSRDPYVGDDGMIHFC